MAKKDPKDQVVETPEDRRELRDLAAALLVFSAQLARCTGALEQLTSAISMAAAVQVPSTPSAPPPAGAPVTKPSGKRASPEELLEEAKSAILTLAQRTGGREVVVKILGGFGVTRASEVPVVKLPEFLAALRTAVGEAKVTEEKT